MNALTSYVVTEHLLDLRREAEAQHLADLASTSSRPSADGNGRGPGRGFAVVVGRSARGLSVALGAFAGWIDPVEPARSTSRNDRTRRPMAA
ncbi:MAG TPA: hypothetical protein VKR30_02060 [Candidatus Limnocylindrales bacterium]|nr:hypothetical protein [Candidatus Limnocylindrales bacterium]